MRILFLYPDLGSTGQGCFAPGIAILSAIAKAKGHETCLLRPTAPPTREGIIRRVLSARPDLVAVGFPTPATTHVRRWISWIREVWAGPLVCGGIHPTLRPREVLAWRGVDAVCRGEGETAFSTIVERLGAAQTLFDDIPGVWQANGPNGSRQDDVSPPVADLDSLPFADRDIFPPFINLHTEGRRACAFMLSRGCPYKCAYCANPYLASLRPADISGTRFRSMASALEEIRAVLRRFPDAQGLIFFDDIFTLREDWLLPLLDAYRHEFHLPFTCNSHVSLLTEKMARALARAGCTEVAMGIESGNRELRGQVLGRTPSDEAILGAFRLCRENGIHTLAYNMIGIPGETYPRFLDTIHLNAAALPDRMFLTTFYPFPETALEGVCRRDGIAVPMPSIDFFDEAQPLELRDFPDREIRFARRHFTRLVRAFTALALLPHPLGGLVARILDRMALARSPLVAPLLGLPALRSLPAALARRIGRHSRAG